MMKLPEELSADPQREDPPPFLGTWRRVYVAVICWLAVLILVFYLFARSFSS